MREACEPRLGETLLLERPLWPLFALGSRTFGHKAKLTERHTNMSHANTGILYIRSDEGLALETSAIVLPHGVHYPHQHSVDTPVCLPHGVHYPHQHSVDTPVCLPHGVHYPHQHSVDTPVCLPPRRRSCLVLFRAGITHFVQCTHLCCTRPLSPSKTNRRKRVNLWTSRAARITHYKITMVLRAFWLDRLPC